MRKKNLFVSPFSLSLSPLYDFKRTNEKQTARNNPPVVSRWKKKETIFHLQISFFAKIQKGQKRMKLSMSGIDTSSQRLLSTCLSVQFDLFAILLFTRYSHESVNLTIKKNQTHVRQVSDF